MTNNKRQKCATSSMKSSTEVILPLYTCGDTRSQTFNSCLFSIQSQLSTHTVMISKHIPDMNIHSFYSREECHNKLREVGVLCCKYLWIRNDIQFMLYMTGHQLQWLTCPTDMLEIGDTLKIVECWLSRCSRANDEDNKGDPSRNVLHKKKT